MFVWQVDAANFYTADGNGKTCWFKVFCGRKDLEQEEKRSGYSLLTRKVKKVAGCLVWTSGQASPGP